MFKTVLTKSMAEVDIKYGLNIVLDKIKTAASKRNPDLQQIEPILVAVSKTKPAEDIITAYTCGQRHFGENYVQELIEKGNNADLLDKCKEIKWHFIGHLQRNKINKVLATPNLYLIETVDSDKIAAALNTAWPKFNEADKLRVMIQVNTSAEEAKNGVEPTEIAELAKYIVEKCTNLQLMGLMTIGKYGYNPDDGPNPDFVLLKKCQQDLAKELNVNVDSLQLSMGMSTDYEQAIELGSTMVRVGTAIFGARAPKV